MMRIRLVGFLLFFAVRLFAQDQNEPYFIQQAPVQLPLDCYQHKLDEGLAAQKRGDRRMALRWFKEALDCPEAIKIPERQEELKALIAQFETKALPAGPVKTRPANAAAASRPAANTATATAAPLHRRYQPSRQFLLFDKPDCFDVTCQEAARAFAGGYWDDAAALYRAAKNCADADQSDRLLVKQRIEECRNASQNELRQKEQEAVRQARHAIAANLANHATQLLHGGDRSLAYRLADFANEYIAPDDNDACRQAIYDALYYNPEGYAGADAGNVQIPFCYQLGDNLDRDLQVRFMSRQSKPSKICAFAHTRNLLFRWDVESFKPEEPVALGDTTLFYFDAVPDGRTLLFLSNKAYVFWRSPREVFRLPVQSVYYYCFNDTGSLFFFLDVSDGQIHVLNLGEVFTQQKGFRQRLAPTPTGFRPSQGLLGMANHKGQLWLGYRDSIQVFRYDRQPEPHWTQQPTQYLGYEVPAYKSKQPPYQWLSPAVQTAILTNDSATYILRPGEADSNTAPPVVLPGNGLDVSANARLVAVYQGISSDEGSQITIYQAFYPTPDSVRQFKARYRARIPGGQDEMQLRSGIFSPDNSLFVTTTSGGKLEVWALTDDVGQHMTNLEDSHYVALNSDGSKVYVLQNDSILLFPADQPGQTLQAMPASYDGLPFLLAGQTWLAYRTTADSLVFTDRLGQRPLTVASPLSDLGETTAAISANEKSCAYRSGEDAVAVCSLDDGHEIANRTFGGAINLLYFVPNTGEVLVVHQVSPDDSGDNDQTVIKLWNPAAAPEVKMRTVRLHDYSTKEVALGAKQDFIAFTNGLDIRLFRQNDLSDEATRIRQYELRMVTALAFHPDKNILAAGYNDGSVVFWDITTGQARLQWPKPIAEEGEEEASVKRLCFIDGGRRLQILLENNVLLTRDADLSLVRTGVQTLYRRLISFRPSQIRQYNLEQALDYPNNFTRLAASGDLPLIRSFFDYYREAAINSNNIQHVSNYCDRALILFGQLEPGAQNALRPILLGMIEDYHWKLLLRNRLDTAQKVVQIMERDFSAPPAATQAAAATALMRDDQRTAARLYATWALRTADQDLENGLLPQSSLDSLHSKVRQLLEYDLIQPGQLDCLCALFHDFTPFQGECSDLEGSAMTPLLDPETHLRWSIFLKVNTLSQVKNLSDKIHLLEKAQADAQLLQRRNPAVARKEIEKITLLLAQTYFDQGAFEHGNSMAVRRFKQAIEKLNTAGPFENTAREQARLAAIVRTYLNIGNTYLHQENLLEAIQAYRQGLQDADRLLAAVEPDSKVYHHFRNDLSAMLYLNLGSAYLLSGNASAAQQAFEDAQNAFSEDINPILFAHTALLLGDTVDAYIQYGHIQTESQLGQALFDIDRMAERLPAQQARLRACRSNLRAARLQSRLQLNPKAVDYHEAYPYIDLYGARENWDSALLWSTLATQLGEQVLNAPDAPTGWHTLWLNALLNQAYYLLFGGAGDTARLSKAISLSLQAEHYLDSTKYFYQYRALIGTNLAHARWLRNAAGDRQLALERYRAFLSSPYEANDPWELLLKDFRDLARAGVKWPDLDGLIRQIKPKTANLSNEDWREIGLRPPDD